MFRRSLRDCRIVVTGASSGIGAAVAARLSQQGARLLLTARREDRLNDVASQCQRCSPAGHRPLLVPGDLTVADIRHEIGKTIRANWSQVDMVINNAGCGAVGPFATASEDRLRKIMELNFFAPVELTRHLLPLLRGGDRPALVNVGSVLGHVAVPKKSEYCASKFALRGWNDALRCELRAEGIAVIWIAPNTTRSEFFDQLLERHGQVAENRWSMTPDQVARKIVRTIERRQPSRVLTLSGHGLVAAGKWTPRLLTRLLARFG